LISEISVYNCVDIIHIAEKFQLEAVEDKSYGFIAEHLNELVKTEEIQVSACYVGKTSGIWVMLSLLLTPGSRQRFATFF